LFHILHSGQLASLGTRNVSAPASARATAPVRVVWKAPHRSRPISPSPSRAHRLPTVLIIGSISNAHRSAFMVKAPSGGFLLVNKSHCVRNISNWICNVGGVRASLIGNPASPSVTPSSSLLATP
jgi:hypothetical protein